MKRRLSFIVILNLILTMGIGCQKTSDVVYKDGKFNGEGMADSQGWKGVIEIEVKDGKIVEVEYDEVNEDGREKSDDEEYAKSMEDASGISPKDAFEQLEDALIKTQSPDRIDAIAGATTSSESFKKLAKEVLDKNK